ncbi:hypothetical protein RhiirC2_777475 [Rhizophagus irregularis]|uniref:Uncharacterized protein n=1 Tax=Rhizophagus irregularis TaxID=588596 RepID=A0A2N1NEH0_9GLOM|nr:hypothetical protein RhiirC2_777475 [Rhizophagus irregularis]
MSWNLEGWITTIITDNGSNMKAAFPFLIQKNKCESIQRLPYAIIQLQADLCTSTNRDDKKDGNKLRKIILSEKEWELLDQLVDLLTPFERTTKDFSEGIYVTFSNMISIIKELIFNMACNLPLKFNTIISKLIVY